LASFNLYNIDLGKLTRPVVDKFVGVGELRLLFQALMDRTPICGGLGALGHDSLLSLHYIF